MGTPQSKNAILILEKSFMETLFFQVALLYMKVFQTDLRKNLMQCAQCRTLLKLLQVLIDITQSGQVDLHSHPLLLSNLNGLQKKSLKRMVPRLSIENAYERCQ